MGDYVLDEYTVVPIYRKWWFWLIIIGAAIMIFFSLNEDNNVVPVAINTQNTAQTSSPVESTVLITQTTAPTMKPTPTKTPKPTQTTAPKSTVKSSYDAGTYEVGKDIPAGEYVIISEFAYFERSKDLEDEIDSIIVNGFVVNRTIITISKGEYFEFTEGIAYPIAKAPKVTVTSDKLPEGMYKIGLDLPAGKYKVVATDDDCYVEIAKDSTHSMYSVVANSIFDGEKHVTVKDGQYLTVNYGYIEIE